MNFSDAGPNGEHRSARRTANRAVILCSVALLGLFASAFAGRALALEPGEAAVDFEAPMLEGDGTISLTQHRGKVVYLDFWASWCAPCQTAIPLIEELRRDFSPDDFQVIAINLDKSAKKAKKFLSKNPVGYPSAADPRGRLPREFGLETMPTSYLIDREGIIRYVHRGFREGDVSAIRAEIEKLVEPIPAAMR